MRQIALKKRGGARLGRRASPPIARDFDACNAANFLAQADGAIVVASLKRDEVITNPVDLERVREMAGRLGEVG